MNKKDLEALADAYTNQEKFTKSPYYWENESFINWTMREAWLAGFKTAREAAFKTLKDGYIKEWADGKQVIDIRVLANQIKALGEDLAIS